MLLLIAGFALTAALIVLFMSWFGEKLTARLVTDHFRAAEYVLEHHQAPEAWLSSLQRDAKARLLTRLDKLIVFFETCPYFEDEDSRTDLLGQLRIERQQWETKPLEALVAKERQSRL
jgi:hypothetical protein